jgi:hypothetical protein
LSFVFIFFHYIECIIGRTHLSRRQNPLSKLVMEVIKAL